MSRNRFRRANTSSLPGYDDQGFESFGHPASQAQPAVDAYGIDSEFGEGVHKGPYRSGPAPASYSWEADHPAATEDIISDYEETSDLYEQNLRKAMERKASKCIEIAESRLGRTASQDEIEDLALRYMDLPSRQINAKLQRIASDFLADDVMQEETGYEGDDTGPGNHMAEDEMADFMAEEEMAEEIAMLKAANARLASRMRRMAEDVVQKETGHEGDDESVEVLDEEEGEGPTKKLASEMMAEDMAILAEMMQEASHMGDADRMAEIMAEMNFLADYKKHNEYGEAAPGFGYQDPDTRGKNRRDRKSEWDGRTKDFHNGEYYYANRKKVWGVDYDGPVGMKFDNTNKVEKKKQRDAEKKKSKKAELMAEDILSDAEFAEIMAEMDRMAIVDRKLGKGYYQNHNEYGEAAPGFGYQDPDTRAKNRREGKPEWDGRTKDFYNPNYYTENAENWKKIYAPRAKKRRDEKKKEKKAFDEMRLASEEQAMLNEMLAEMEAEMMMADQNDPSHFDMTAEEEMAMHHMAEESEATMMAEEMAEEMAEDVMGLHMASENVDVDPKLARIFQAAEEEASEAEASEEEASEEEATEEATATTQKAASFRPQTQARQASVKTLGNISREASSASDELSKLWESAPDVSKYFG